MDSKKYNNIKIAIEVFDALFTIALFLGFLLSGLSLNLENYLGAIISGKYLTLVLYVIVVGFAVSVIFFPLNYYSGFYLEHKYNLSNQNFIQWIWEDIKGVFVSAVIGLPLLLAFYKVLNLFGDSWWLPFAIILFLFSVVLGRIAPVVILPLFYKITPLEEGELKTGISVLAKEAGLKVKNVFRFDMSKNTKKANAAFTGLGKSKRILLGDTLLNNFSADQIETVIAHELGHYKKKHIAKNILIGTAGSFITLYLIAFFYKVSLVWFGFHEITQIAALPVLALWAMLIGFVQMPLSASISRYFEYQADEYAVKATGKGEAFIETLKKLNEQNLGDKNPHPFVEWFSYSHPSINKRIAAIQKLKTKK